MKKFLTFIKWVLPLIFYFTGIFFIKSINVESLKYAEQEEYTYTDSNGEEHEGETLIYVKGIGRVYTYKDVYLLSIPMFLISLILGSIIFGHGDTSYEDLRCIVFANCIIGLLLLPLTSKGHIVPTILFWLGIFATGFNNEIWKKR